MISFTRFQWPDDIPNKPFKLSSSDERLQPKMTPDGGPGCRGALRAMTADKRSRAEIRDDPICRAAAEAVYAATLLSTWQACECHDDSMTKTDNDSCAKASATAWKLRVLKASDLPGNRRSVKMKPRAELTLL